MSRAAARMASMLLHASGKVTRAAGARQSSTTGAARALASLPAIRSAALHRARGSPLLQHVLAGRCSPLVGLPRQQRLTLCAAASTEAPEETYTYQAEVDRLMDMIVHSLYSNREVFLRELVSNASDALDKLRLLGLTNPDAYKSGGDALEVRIKADKDAHTVTIEDTGVGMTKEELLSSLGTIARSGTAKFMEQMKEAQDANLIGQFGVGFYSAFLVSDKVTVETRSYSDDKVWVWESEAGAHQYKVREEPASALARGTRITLHLKTDAWEFADDKKLGGLIKQYSEFIAFPIKLWAASSVPETVEDAEATQKAQEEEDKKAGEEGREPTKVAPVTKTETVTKWDWKVQNDNKPLWTRSPKEVSKEEYNQFYKTTFREFLDPLAVSHFNVEGTIEFSAMLFVPGMAPFDQQDALARSRSIRLYVKRVFISDEFDEDLLPRYLTFVKGVVDSADLPLNVSREILQESRVVRAIKRQLVKRALDMLNELAGREDKSDYLAFWEAFGRNVKLGVIEDQGNRDTLAKLLRFESSESEGLTSLAEYVARKKEGQKNIYYLAADSRDTAEAAPFVEKLRKRGLEVLYLTEPIDEVAASTLQEFEGLALTDVSREDLQLGEESEEEKAAAKAAAEALQPLTDYMKKVLGERVEKVVVSNRLTDSPAIVVTSKFGWSANMERIMRAQAMGDNRAAEYMRGRRIMEINPDHPIIQALKAKVELDSREAKDQVQLLYEAASLTGGLPVDNPKDFAARIYSLMGASSGSSSSSSAASSSSGGGSEVKQVDAEVV